MATKKNTPAVRELRYSMNASATPGTSASSYIDLAKDLSAVNRRLYRQGRDYHVKRVTIVSTTTPNSGNKVSVGALSDSWVTRNAWRRGFDTWTKMNNDALHNTSKSVKSTWHDFKIRMDLASVTGTQPTPKDMDGNTYGGGEWSYSKYVSPDLGAVDEFEIYMLGDHNGAAGAWNYVGLVKSYAESRATVQVGSPNVPSPANTDPLTNVFDYGETIDDVIDNIEAENDEAPYDTFNYIGELNNGPGPTTVQIGTLNEGRLVLGGFNAIAGLLRIDLVSTVPNDAFDVVIELAPGKYRGISAEVI